MQWGKIEGNGRDGGELQKDNFIGVKCFWKIIWKKRILPIVSQFCCVSLFAYICEYKYVSVVSPCFGFPDSSAGQESACNAGEPDSIPGLGGSTG